MSLSHSWFQSWQPPTGSLTDNPPFHSASHYTAFEMDHKYPNSNGITHPMLSFLPYFLSMGIFTNHDDLSKYSSNNPYNIPISLEKTGPFNTWYRWKEMDFEFFSDFERQQAMQADEYIPANVLPLGIEVHKNRLFVTFPKWKSGIPCTLAVLPKVPKEPSPALSPYPSWQWHNTESCRNLISVFRIKVDNCNRLWILDSGQINVSIKPEQICPPKIVIFDLTADKLIMRYELPEKLIKQDSLFSNIMLDVRENDCENVHAYLADVWRFGLVVFSLKKMKSWRVTDHLFYPDPLAAAYKIHDLEFEWTDGIFGLALSPINPATNDRILYFHPMSSFREFYVKTSIICNETGWIDSKYGFRVLGESRGKYGHASASGMDRNGILFYNLVSRDSVGCWDSRKPYKRSNFGIAAQNSTTLVFPNDLKIDQEQRQSIWIVSNRLPYFLYKELDKYEFNFRIMSAYTDEAVYGTICDPKMSYYDSFDPIADGDDCY